MRRKLKLITVILLGSVVVCLALLAAINWRVAAKYNRPFDSDKLTLDDHRQLTEVIRLKEHLGERFWPEFASTEIPIVLYNDLYEFAIGLKEIPVGWDTVDGDHFQGMPYYRWKKKQSQAFAVKIDDTWAGSIDSREYLTRGFLLKLREELPPVLSQLFPHWIFIVDESFHAVIVLHEVFHAFQAIKVPKRFEQAMDVYAFEKDYPFQNIEFIEAWNLEGAALSTAINTENESILRENAAEFLRLRQARRTRFNLSSELISFEKELEWLEGMAKYAEIRFYELASSSEYESSIANYDPNLRRWSDEFRRLKRGLGKQRGDFRFYLSGMAQARLLDRILPDWKESVFKEGIYLEDLLQMACSRLEDTNE